MNAGTFPGAGAGLGGAAPRVTGLLRSSAVAVGVSSIAAAAQCAQSTVATTVADANALVQIVSVTGRGCINWAGFYPGTAVTGRVVLEIDGQRVADRTSAFSGSNGLILVGGGDGSTTPPNAVFQPIRFNSGFRILGGASASSTTLFAAVNAEIYA